MVKSGECGGTVEEIAEIGVSVEIVLEECDVVSFRD